jgi:hypothetical protein
MHELFIRRLASLDPSKQWTGEDIRKDFEEIRS